MTRRYAPPHDHYDDVPRMTPELRDALTVGREVQKCLDARTTERVAADEDYWRNHPWVVKP